MAFPTPPFYVDNVLWDRAVLLLGQGESRLPQTNEIRMFLESGEWILKAWNGSAWVETNRARIYIDNQTGTRALPLIQGGRVTYGAGVLGTVTFNTAYSSTPTVVATPDNITGAHIYVKTITTTSFGICTDLAGYKQWMSVGPA